MQEEELPIRLMRRRNLKILLNTNICQSIKSNKSQQNELLLIIKIINESA